MSSIKFKGIINYCVYDENNNIQEQGIIENLITNLGMDIIIKCLTGEITIGAIHRFGIGTDSTPQLVTDTALKNKLLHVNTTATVEGTSLTFELNLAKNTVTNNTWIREMGLMHFNGTTETLVTRAALSSAKAIFITPNNTLSLKYQISISNL